MKILIKGMTKKSLDIIHISGSKKTCFIIETIEFAHPIEVNSWDEFDMWERDELDSDYSTVFTVLEE
jgi:hypothetical protein